MMKKEIKVIEKVFVNLITLTRLFGAVSLPFFYVYKSMSDVAIITLCLFLTDCFDGFLARHLNVSSFFGSMIDAISDKLLNFISFTLLGITYETMLLPLVIEISILYTSYSTYRYGGNVKSEKIGKIKTIILDVFVILSFIIISLEKIHTNNKIIIWLTKNTNMLINMFSLIITISCIIALLDYIKKYKNTRNDKTLSFVKYNQKNKKSFKMIIHDLFDTKYYLKHKDEPIVKQLYTK